MCARHVGDWPLPPPMPMVTPDPFDFLGRSRGPVFEPTPKTYPHDGPPFEPTPKRYPHDGPPNVSPPHSHVLPPYSHDRPPYPQVQVQPGELMKPRALQMNTNRQGLIQRARNLFDRTHTETKTNENAGPRTDVNVHVNGHRFHAHSHPHKGN